MLQEGKHPATVLNFLSHAAVGLRNLGRASPRAEQSMRDARHAVQRLLPRAPVRQANPATPATVARLCAGGEAPTALAVALLWATAARHSDWSRVRAEDLVDHRGGWFTVKYRSTKTSSRGVSRTVVFSLPRAAKQHLRRRILEHPDAVFPLSYHQLHKELQVRGSGLTPHSFRRGAIQALLDGGLPPQEVARLTGHQRLTTMYAYADRVPRTAWRAMARAYRLLCTA